MPRVNIRNKEGPPETEIEAVRRHACEAKHRVARQEALLAKMERDHSGPVALCRETLETLRTSLTLAIDHLHRLEKKVNQRG